MYNDNVIDRDGKNNIEDGSEETDPDELNMEEPNFDWFYDLSDVDGEFLWSEMSYRRYEKQTGWNDFEPTEFEVFQSEVYN